MHQLTRFDNPGLKSRQDIQVLTKCHIRKFSTLQLDNIFCIRKMPLKIVVTYNISSYILLFFNLVINLHSGSCKNIFFKTRLWLIFSILKFHISSSPGAQALTRESSFHFTLYADVCLLIQKVVAM